MKRIFEPIDLTAWRNALGLTQAAAAEALCTHLRTFQTWEKLGEAPRLVVKHAQLMEKLRLLS